MLLRRWLILDCNFLSHRAKYTFGDLSHAGSATGVVYGFLKDIIALIDRFHTDRLLFCWDSRAKKRREIFPEYKANREKKELTREERAFDEAFYGQMNLLRSQYLKTIGFRNVYQQKGYEGDDIIAALCQHPLIKKEEAVIVTADHDLYQMIRPNITWYNPKSPGTYMTYSDFFQTFGLTPEKWAEVKAIAGCNTDGIPGIVGVGEKTAVKYMLGQLKETTKVYTAIKEGEKIIARNMQLVTLPLPGTTIPKILKNDIQQSGWDAVTKKLGMKSIRYARIGR